MDRIVGLTNLGVVLEIYHHQGNQWEGGAAILHGQEFLHRYELRTKVIGQIIEAWGGAVIVTHVSTSLGMSRLDRRALRRASQCYKGTKHYPGGTMYKYARTTTKR